MVETMLEVFGVVLALRIGSFIHGLKRTNFCINSCNLLIIKISLSCLLFFILVFRMTTESFEEFADRFVSEVTSYFIKIYRHKVKITSDCIKIQMYCYDNWEEIDFKAIHAICNDVTKQNIDALKVFNFNKIVFFSFDGEQGKLTVKWLKVLYIENECS